jgi:Domain of unknown function (DUF4263)
LSAKIGSLLTELTIIDRIAFEYELFGDFQCDLVIGDSQNATYCFVEFEDAMPNSLFSTKTTKFKPEFSTRLEHGYSQIIDWFQLLNQVSDVQMRERFNAHDIDFHGILIIGRSHFIASDNNRNRLLWRSKNVIVSSKRIRIITYDELFQLLYDKFRLNYAD